MVDRHVWLLSSGGRRGALLQILENFRGERQSAVVVTDASDLSAAGQMAEFFERVPRINEPEFIPTLLEICKRLDVDVVVPTIDTELGILAANRNRFLAVGTDVLISTPEVIELSFDKWKFHNWLESKGFPSIKTYEVDGFRPCDLAGPVVAKPRSGSSSIGVVRASNAQNLVLEDLGSDYIIQEHVDGVEITIDFAVSKNGVFLGAVPRKRIEVRGGEVSKGVTIRHELLEDFVRRFAQSLPGAYGILNVQVFLDVSSGEFRVLELNGRVGGGYPLTHAAGADFFALLASGCDEPLRNWQEDLLMLRYDEAVFVSGLGAVSRET